MSVSASSECSVPEHTRMYVPFLQIWHKSEILDLCHYQNFYEFPKFRIKLLILILLHFNIVRIIY